ncbi:MAG: hypothetical protein GX638_09135, partial [Crenarchaeota archaeon]|nr:hypothetical protein [Thermoproteota archaeon]
MPDELAIKVWEAKNLPSDWSNRIKALKEKNNDNLRNTVKEVIETIKQK